MYYINGDITIGDPSNASIARNYQIGGLDASGSPIIPAQWGTGATASTNPMFFYSGDPVSYSGWLDNDPRDKRFLINNGPFSLALGDTQDVVIAYVVGRGTDHLNSITKLRERASYLDDFFPFGRLLHVEANNTLISTDSTFAFEAKLLSLAFRDSIETASWTLTARPIGSTAQIIPGAGFTATLDPDLPGDYAVRLEATITGNVILRDSITVTAVDNHPPVAQLSITPAEMVFGQTATADASASFDPDSDPLSYEWTFSEWISRIPFFLKLCASHHFMPAAARQP